MGSCFTRRHVPKNTFAAYVAFSRMLELEARCICSKCERLLAWPQPCFSRACREGILARSATAVIFESASAGQDGRAMRKRAIVNEVISMK